MGSHLMKSMKENSKVRHFLLIGTSVRRTPLQNGYLELVPAFLYSSYLTLYKTDTSVINTPRVGP